MKYLLILVVFGLLAVCERPPKNSDIDRVAQAPNADVEESLRSGPNAASASKELQQIDTLIAIIERTIDTGQLAGTRTMHPTLKSFAADVVRSRQSLLQKARTYRIGRWGDEPSAANFDAPPGDAAREKSDIEKLGSLKAAAFDSEFVVQIEALDQASLVLVGELRSSGGASGDLADVLTRLSDAIGDDTAKIAQFRSQGEAR